MKNLFFCIIVVCFSLNAFSWGKSGHMIIGQLADQYLTDKTRTEIEKILGKETIDKAGIWMDAVMNDDEYHNQDHWHYAYKDMEHQDNALAKLYQFSAYLADESVEPAEKLLPLRALIHIAGDIHCPIHCGYFEDHGGHKVKVTWSETDEKSNLHKVWDTDLIAMTKKTDTEYVKYLKSNLSADNMNAWSNMHFSAWAKESQTLLDQVYDYNDKMLNKSYYEKNISVVDERLSQAAVRLAYVLNSVFDPK